MLTKNSFLLLSLSLYLLTACGGGDVTVESLANASGNKQFKVNTLASTPTNNPQETSIATDADGDDYLSLTAASTDTGNDVDKIFVLQALAVNRNDVSDYERSGSATNWNKAKIQQNVTVSQATDSALSLTFNSAGQIAALTIYDANKTYQSVTTNGPISDGLLIGTINREATNDATTTTIMADRRADFFGFAPKYMVYISWNLAKETHSLASNSTNDSIYEYDSSMIAGIETSDNNIPTIGTTDFSGKGRGRYGDIRIAYATTFDMVAEVNFARFVAISSSNTMRCEDNSSKFSDCTQIAAPELNFNGLANNLTGVINGTLTASALFGSFNARFYGNVEGNANELGGTFAMVSGTNDSYYYGAFGGERDNIFVANTNQFAIDALTAKPTSADLQQATYIGTDTGGTAYMSLTAASADNMNSDPKMFTLQGLAVQKNDSKTHSRSSTAPDWNNSNFNRKVELFSITSPALSVSFDMAGKISAVTAYFADKTYIADISNGTSSASNLSGIIGDDSIGAPDDASGTVMKADRSSNIFGYNVTSNYMLYVDWLAEKELDDAITGFMQNTYSNHGMMIAGMETEVVNFPAGDAVLFEGKGRGYYGSLADNYATIFNMIANVDFTAFTVDFQALSTMSCTSETNISTCINSADALDFTADLKFDDGNGTAIKAISGMASIDALTGTVDARFYGGMAEEFGGTFALRNDSSYYYGAFGGYNFGFANVATSGTVSNPRPANSVLSYDSFDEASGNSITLPAMAVHYTKTGTTTNLERITTRGNDSSAVTLTFDTNQKITNARTYFANQSYGLTPTSALANQIIHDNTMNNITAEVTLISSATNIDLQFSRVNSTIYDFEPKYMMIGWWLISNADGDINNGNMVVGFETAGSGLEGIPNTGNVEFKGGSIGFYNSDSDSQKFQTKSSITVNVDFTTRTVDLTSDATFMCVTVPNDCNTAMPSLDFSTADNTAPKYGTGENNISAVIVTTNDDMSGRFDARFYGNNAAELGGTFIMQSADNDKSYMGAFITNR